MCACCFWLAGLHLFGVKICRLPANFQPGLLQMQQQQNHLAINTVWKLSNSHHVQVGSEDIDSGEGSQSDEGEGSANEDGCAGPSDRQDDAENSEEDDEDEVGDLSWEAVMAAVQGGGSDDDDDDGGDELKAVAAAAHNGHADAEPEALPKQAVKAKPRKSFRALAAGKQGKAANKKSSKLGKRSRQT